MAEYVKDAVLTNAFEDLVLLRLVEITLASIHSERPLFSNLLDEPVFFRKYFRYWVGEALEEKRLMSGAQAGNPFSKD